MAKENDKELNFEKALEKLESIVQAIEQGEVGLTESIQRYEEGMNLIRRCRTILTEAEQKIQKLQLAEDGALHPQPFDAQQADAAGSDAP